MSDKQTTLAVPRPAPAKPLPSADDPFNARFWDGLRQGRLMLQTCMDCHVPRFPASRHCPHCHSELCDWLAVDGHGVVESFCTFHKAYWPGFAADVPYSVVQVRMTNGVRFYSNLVGVDTPDIQIGMQVQAVFERVEGSDVTLLKFKPNAQGAT
jgi:uncharacterized OB-fold protein